MLVEGAIVLAAGASSRFPRDVSVHKLLARIASYTLVEYPIRSLASAGIDSITVVTNSTLLQPISKVLRGVGAEIMYVVNDEVRRGNAYSLVLGLEKSGWGRVLVSMADHIYLPRTVKRLLEGYRGDLVAIGVDRDPTHVDVSEATLVRVDRDGRVVEVGKGLGSWSYVDVGLHIVSRDILGYFSTCGEPAELSKLYSCVASRVGRVGVVDLTGEPWVDVDTGEDYLKLSEGPWKDLAIEVVLSWGSTTHS